MGKGLWVLQAGGGAEWVWCKGGALGLPQTYTVYLSPSFSRSGEDLQDGLSYKCFCFTNLFMATLTCCIGNWRRASGRKLGPEPCERISTVLLSLPNAETL